MTMGRTFKLILNHKYFKHRDLSLCPLQKDEVYLNLVLDFVPETVYRVARHFNKAKSIIPIIYVKVIFCFFPQRHFCVVYVCNVCASFWNLLFLNISPI